MPETTDSTSIQHVLSMDADELTAFFERIGQQPFRAKQVLQWIYERNATNFDEMTNLSKLLRDQLTDQLAVRTSQVVKRSRSRDGTVKLLLQWPDGETSECVLIPAKDRMTACISSQVGCPAGCKFCASGLDGFIRNLTTGEMVEQALCIRDEASARESRLSNVVVMGIGEPLANYDAVVQAVTTINAPWGMNIGARRITISTVGLPKQIRRLAAEGMQINLALSIHAATDGLRKELIPWAQETSLTDLVDACNFYFRTTGREITLEYVLLHEVNDRRTHAEYLGRLARRLRCNVNLILYNPVEGLPYQRPTNEATQAFQQVLQGMGVNVHVRFSRGTDIHAACGQLRRREAAEQG